MYGGNTMIKLIIKEKSYDKVIFTNTQIEAKEGDFIGIKGPSGSGKSTLLSILGLLEKFDGEYYFEGQLITKKTAEKIRQANIAYIFQKPYLISYLNVKENILMPLKNAKEKWDASYFEEVIKLLSIEDLIHRYPENLSGGEAQRVAIARAIMTKRKLILCDEPTGALDPDNSKKVMDKLKEIVQKYNQTIIMVTHSNDFDNYFNKLFYIRNEKIQYDK